MQTFLPYSVFQISAKCLDRLRLGKQRVECKQILKSINTGDAWSNHPAVLMWQGYERALLCYYMAICQEWIARGYTHNMQVYPVLSSSLQQEVKRYGYRSLVESKYIAPDWLGDTRFHRSHRSNLLRKDPEFYGKYGWDVPTDLPYVWPVRKRK